MDATRFMIVNADDFGHSPEVNAGVIEAHDRGIVTSASLMVLRPAAVEAARCREALAVGLHAEIGDERPLTEIRAQLERFRSLTGRDPTHLDSHQHVHRREPARSAMIELAVELGVPLREHDPRIGYLGDFYGQTDTGEPWPDGVTVSHLVSLLRSLPEGVTELGCHPAKGVPSGTSYAVERTVELRTLCDPEVRHTIEREGIALLSFADLKRKGR